MQLYPYQERVVDFIVNSPASFIILDMGLGKTVSAFTAIQQLVDGCMVHKVLIIAPLRPAAHTWPNEHKKWEHLSSLKISIVLGSAANRKEALKAEADVYIINIDNIVWLISETGRKFPFDMVVIDESSLLKSPSTKRFKYLKKILHKIKRLVLLTGTPSPKGLIDLWSQVYLLDQGQRLGRTITSYRDKYFDSDYMGYKYIPKDWAHDDIMDRIQDLSISMRAEDYIEVPEIIYSTEYAILNDKEMARYKDMARQLFIDIDDTTIDAVSAGVLCGKLQQMAQGAIYDGDKEAHHIHDKKLEVLKELVEMAQGENVIIVYTFQHDRVRLMKSFPLAIDIKSKGAIDRWNKGKIPILLCHPASAGHGLNLQHGGSILIWFGLTWSLELLQQMNARLHRQGQLKPVRCYYIVAQDTIDIDIIDSLQSKEINQLRIIQSLAGLLN